MTERLTDGEDYPKGEQLAEGESPRLPPPPSLFGFSTINENQGSHGQPSDPFLSGFKVDQGFFFCPSSIGTKAILPGSNRQVVPSLTSVFTGYIAVLVISGRNKKPLWTGFTIRFLRLQPERRLESSHNNANPYVPADADGGPLKLINTDNRSVCLSLCLPWFALRFEDRSFTDPAVPPYSQRRTVVRYC